MKIKFTPREIDYIKSIDFCFREAGSPTCLDITLLDLVEAVALLDKGTSRKPYRDTISAKHAANVAIKQIALKLGGIGRSPRIDKISGIGKGAHGIYRVTGNIGALLNER